MSKRPFATMGNRYVLNIAVPLFCAVIIILVYWQTPTGRFRFFSLLHDSNVFLYAYMYWYTKQCAYSVYQIESNLLLPK